MKIEGHIEAKINPRNTKKLKALMKRYAPAMKIAPEPILALPELMRSDIRRIARRISYEYPLDEFAWVLLHCDRVLKRNLRLRSIMCRLPRAESEFRLDLIRIPSVVDDSLASELAAVDEPLELPPTSLSSKLRADARQCHLTGVVIYDPMKLAVRVVGAVEQNHEYKQLEEAMIDLVAVRPDLRPLLDSVEAI